MSDGLARNGAALFESGVHRVRSVTGTEHSMAVPAISAGHKSEALTRHRHWDGAQARSRHGADCYTTGRADTWSRANHVRDHPAPLPGVPLRRKDSPDSRIQAIELSIGGDTDDVAQTRCDRAHRGLPAHAHTADWQRYLLRHCADCGGVGTDPAGANALPCRRMPSPRASSRHGQTSTGSRQGWVSPCSRKDS